MDNHSRLRVAIIGSGVAGASAAYFLHKALRNHVETTVYEKETRIGGRIQRIKIGGEELEAGGSIIHSENRYLSTITSDLGLEKAKHVYNNIGMWDGRSFTFRTGSKEIATMAKVLKRYGMSTVKIQLMVKDMIKKLSQIYIEQERGAAYTDPKGLFEALGLYSLSQVKSYDFFREKQISDRFIEEFVNGISRLNYGQDAGMHSLVNLVSLAGASFGGYLYAIKGGNAQMCEAMLRKASAMVLRNTAVAGIEKSVNGSILITEDGTRNKYDCIIVAAPLEMAGIEFIHMDIQEKNKISRPYQTTNVTYVLGELEPQYFGLVDGKQLPSNILTREDARIPFSSIEFCTRDQETNLGIYRIFSRQALAEDVLKQLFAKRAETKTKVWKAYPVLAPAEVWPSFSLADGIYYVNAMESAVSTMETEVIGSKNVVNLLLKEQRILRRNQEGR